MRVLVGCEYSGVVRRAFMKEGHDVISCDFLPSEDDSPYHYQGDVFDLVDDQEFDLGIFHPPCTHLAVSGARHFQTKQISGVQQAALSFVKRMFDSRHKFKKGFALENPISIISSKFCKPSQIIHPYYFGHPEFKATCLWLEGLPFLRLTDLLTPPERDSAEWIEWNKVHRMPPSEDRWKNRSRTYPNIAKAMAEQWGDNRIGNYPWPKLVIKSNTI